MRHALAWALLAALLVAGVSPLQAMTPAQLAKNSQGVTPGVFGDNLVLSNGTDADHDIDIAAGVCGDSTGTYRMRLAATLTKQLDASFSAGTNAGGLFTGSIASSTWYHVFLIRHGTTGAIDAGFDTSPVAANIPSGYTAYCRIGAVRTDGSANILGFVQYKDKFLYKAPVSDVSNSATWTTSRVTVTISTPLGVVVEPIVVAWAQKNSVLPFLQVVPLAVTDAATDLTNLNGLACIATGVTAQQEFGGMSLVTNTSSQIAVRSSSENCTGYLNTRGWIDPRGKVAAQ